MLVALVAGAMVALITRKATQFGNYSKPTGFIVELAVALAQSIIPDRSDSAS